MKLSSLLLLVSLATAQADMIQLTTGKSIQAQVTGYADGKFTVEDNKHNTSQLPAATVSNIDFEKGVVDAAFETRTKGKFNGRVSMYNRSAFHLTGADGAVERLPSTMVIKAAFGEITEATPAPAPAKVLPEPGKPITTTTREEVRKVEQVSGGNLEKYLAHGKVTIVDFYADWCGPCRSIGPYLEDLAKQNDDVVLRKVNVDKNQQLAERYGVSGIPHIMIFDKAGKSLGTIVGADRTGVKRLMDKAKGSS